MNKSKWRSNLLGLVIALALVVSLIGVFLPVMAQEPWDFDTVSMEIVPEEGLCCCDNFAINVTVEPSERADAVNWSGELTWVGDVAEGDVEIVSGPTYTPASENLSANSTGYIVWQMHCDGPDDVKFTATVRANNYYDKSVTSAWVKQSSGYLEVVNVVVDTNEVGQVSVCECFNVSFQFKNTGCANMTDIFGWLYALDDTEFNCPPNSGDMDIKTGFLKNEDGISYVLEPREQTEVYTVVMHCTGTGQGGIHIIPYGNDACGNEIAGKSYITRWQQVFSVSCNATVTKVGHNTTFTAIVGEDAAPPWVWEWDFGDGATASGGPTSNPVIVTNHAYAAANVSPGWYACIEVTDDNGITVECCSYATVYDELTASCNVSANSTGAGETVTFTGTASGGFPECPAPNCCNYFWEWDFGDGSSVSGPGYGPIVVNHAYNICGTFIAVFTIQDDCLNNTASCNATVEVVPGITCYDYETTVCQAVNFTADITCDFPGASWFWDFGDGTNSTAQSPSHAYMCTGTYNYTVEVCDEFDNCVNCTGTVEVTIKPPQLISPPNGSEPTNKEVTFEWEDIGCCDYTLFVYQKDSDVKIWMVQTGKVNHWTGIVFNGEWRWFVVAKDACNETVTSDQWLFDMDQKAPAVVVNSPNGGETLTCNSTWAITWYADPAEGSINIDYSSDGGATWKPVATGEVNDGAYPWKVPCINSDLCLVKVSVYDAATGWAHDTSDGVFSITTAPAPTSSIELGTGWNLISLPLIPTTYNITTILADISGNVTIVWYYDAATAGWLRYVPGSLSNTLTTMEDGKGYFVFMAAPESLTVTGQEMPTPPATPPTYNVYAGWNLIGFKSTTPMNHALYLLSMAGKYIVLWGYDNATGYFSVYPLGAHGGNMEPGHGYWLWATADGLIVPP